VDKILSMVNPDEMNDFFDYLVNYPTVWLDILKENYLNDAEFKAKFEKVASDNECN